MEKLFNQFKYYRIESFDKIGTVCGYTDNHFLVAVETDSKTFFKKPKKAFILEEFDDPKFRFANVDESTLLSLKKMVP